MIGFLPSAQDIYIRLPRFLQNLALDIKGIGEHRIRFSGIYPQQRELARSLRHSSRSEVELIALHRVNEIIRMARDGTDYYAAFWGPRAPGAISSFSDLQALPILTKHMIRSANEDFRCRLVETPIVLQTTGTTGTPINVYSTLDARRRNYAYFDDFLSAHGINPRGRRVVLGGRIIVSVVANELPWRLSRATKTLYLSSYHISKVSALDYFKVLRKYRPEYIEAYPSAICALARMLIDLGADLGQNIPVVTSAESLTDDQEAIIKQAFGPVILDQYGAAEMSVYAERCLHGHYHVREDYAHVEVLAPDGSECVPGQTGRVVCTGLVNEGMPLIRYEIGDMVEVAGPRCPCGWDTPIWSRIIGRLDDVVWTPSGRAIGRLSPVLKGFPVLEAQFVQDRIDQIRVLVVAGSGFDEHVESRIQQAVAERVGNDMEISVERVAQIPAGPGGKRRAVVSSITAPRPA